MNTVFTSVQPEIGPKAAAILTGGGNCPGLNDAICGAKQRAEEAGYRVLGVPNGFEGLLGPDELAEIKATSEDLRRRPGSILGLSRVNPAPVGKEKECQENGRFIAEKICRHNIEFVIAIGGDDTLGATRRLVETGVFRANGVPKTIDNDVAATERTFGFETAVAVGIEHAAGMRIEAELYHRVSIVETMGRNAGWIALEVGDRADADIVLLPEFAIDDKHIVSRVKQTLETKGNALIVVSEGFLMDGKVICADGSIDPHGHEKLGGVRFILEQRLRKEGIKSTSTAVSYAHRFGAPIEDDADFAWVLGRKAVDAALQGLYGVVAVRRAGKITVVPLAEIKAGRPVPVDLYDLELLKKRCKKN